MDLLISDDFFRNQGSLIYSLQNLDCKAYFIQFIDLLCIGGFEVRQMSECIIEKYAAYITSVEKEKALAILNIYQSRYELNTNINDRLNRIEFINAAIELIKD